jgi:hypothetical protein
MPHPFVAERGFAVLLAAFLAGCGKEAPPPPRAAPEVTVIDVEPKPIPYTPVFVAQTESSRQVNIVARVSGFLDASRTRKASWSSRASSCSSSTRSRSRRSSMRARRARIAAGALRHREVTYGA